jgi:hypothetical protein
MVQVCAKEALVRKLRIARALRSFVGFKVSCKKGGHDSDAHPEAAYVAARNAKGTDMNEIVAKSLNGLRMGPGQNYRNIIVFPCLNDLTPRIDYQVLSDATRSASITIQEVSQSGSVPELRVTNRGSKPVLLLDGEELIGAKQNRVLNTTILLKENSDTVVPVSCTERGRWSFSSPHFAPSDVVMAQKIRAKKLRSVSACLESQAKYHSDQSEVWHEISALHCKAQSHSPTDAMHDAFAARSDDLSRASEAFPLVNAQKGLLVLINGEVAGFDLVSQPGAYSQLHRKLVNSYAFEALVERREGSPGAETAEAKARAFLEEALSTTCRSFPSVGYGTDCRFNGNSAAGSALLHEGEVVHVAFFHLPKEEEPDRMWSLGQRRRNFRE